MNPTKAVLEERVAALEGGTAALAVASGHAAQLLAFHTLLEPGDDFVAARQLYGGSINQFNQSFAKFGWQSLGRRGRSRLLQAAITEDQGDLRRIDRQSRRHHHRHREGGRHRQGGRCPAHRRQHAGHALSAPPKDYGADIVVHSLTKFLGGHGNSMGGAIVDGGTFDWGNSGKYPLCPSPARPITA